MNCREIRCKCDETKPECRRCVSRGVACKGYVRTLRWVGQSFTGKTSTRKQNSDLTVQNQKAVTNPEDDVSSQLSLSKLLPTLHPLDALDRALFEHWMMMSVQLACLDPASIHELRQIHHNTTTKEKSIAFPAILANSAAHLLSLGKIPASTFTVLQQRAISALRGSLNNVSKENLTRESSTPSSDRMPFREEHIPLPPLDDDVITGSLLLIGCEIIQPHADHGETRIQILLQGTCSLVAERYKYFCCSCSRLHPARSQPEYKLDSPYFQSTVQSLAWVDIMACLPSARPPILDKKYWPEEAIHASQESVRQLRPNNNLGYCAKILSLLGDCTTTVHSLYTQTISEEEFDLRQSHLGLLLEEAMAELPKPEVVTMDTLSNKSAGCSRSAMVEAHNFCLHAAICHGLANQIFLTRATDHARDSPRIKSLRDRLFESLCEISTAHSVVSKMLWPLWVLGCESYLDRGDSLREFVITFLQAAYKRQHTKNVEKCLITLRDEVWTLNASIPEKDCENHLVQQSAWVWHCWIKDIRLILA